MPELTSATLACRRVIVAALLADPVVSGTVGARIYRGVAPLLQSSVPGAPPQPPPYPYITVASLSMTTTHAAGGDLVAAQPLFLVLLVGATEAQQEACVPAMLDALTGTQGTSLGVAVQRAVNEGDYADEPTLPTGQVISRSGARLRFFCQNAA